MIAILAGIFSNKRARATPAKRKWSWKLLAVCLGLLVSFGVAEGALRVLGLPRSYQARTTTPQFTFYKNPETGRFFYVNTPSSPITFHYDSNPRGYFQPGNLVVHQTNQGGFRGPDWSLTKPPNTIRVAFLGDSFTFGEGVHFEDTFAEVTTRLLTSRFAGNPVRFEALNMGVGGFNTADELNVLKTMLPRLQPDVVVLCYALNDAEPPLFEVDPVKGPVRRPREALVAEGQSQPAPPDSWLYKSRIADLVWQVAAQRRQNAATEAYYQGLYRPDAAGWTATRQALGEVVAFCRAEKIPLVVMIFPLMHKLDAGYPFQNLHGLVLQEVTSRGGSVLDLLPAFQGQSAEQMWVHPTDQHPNEKAHRIAAEQLANYLAMWKEFLDRVATCQGP